MKYIFLTLSLILTSGIVTITTRQVTNTHQGQKMSHCDNCDKPLLFWHKVPVMSYVILRGKCYYCKKTINPTSFILEVLTALLALITYPNYSIIILFFTCLILSLSDYYTQTIDVRLLIIPALALAALNFAQIHWAEALFIAFVLGALAYFSGGLGFGDVYFVSFCTLFWPILPIIQGVIISCVLGLIVFGWRYLRHKPVRVPIPFIPLLSIGIILSILIYYYV